MTVPPLALSLSNSVTEVGALAAFAALVGIAILSLLAFSQAREIKRLREWAGRAPERAAELEQRVSADAAARVQHAGPAAPATRVVPRKTPLVSAPVSTAVNATVAAVVPGATGTRAPSAGSRPAGGDEKTPAPASKPPAQSEGTPGAEHAQEAGATAADDGGAGVVGEAGGAAEDAAVAQPMAPSEQPGGASAQPAGRPAAVEPPSDEQAALIPATAAARAAGVSARAPLPPSPAAPAPPGVPSTSGPASASGPAVTGPRPASRPPAPPAAAAARRVSSRAVGTASDVPPRSPSPSRARPASAMADAVRGRSGVTRPATAAGAAGPKYFKPERSSGRALALIAGGVIAGVLVLVVAVSALKGGGSKATATRSSSAAETRPASSHAKKTARAVATNPAETAVVVLNGTATAGLAHHLAADLQQSGYARAAASAGVPPGTHAATVVEYAHGNRADAQAVARKLNVTRVQPIETAIASLAGSSTVVVVAGADQASLLGGGGAQSNGEPAATG